MLTKQIDDAIKIPSVSDGRAWVWADADLMMTKQIGDATKIRSVSDGGAWGWGPMRIK